MKNVGDNQLKPVSPWTEEPHAFAIVQMQFLMGFCHLRMLSHHFEQKKKKITITHYNSKMTML